MANGLMSGLKEFGTNFLLTAGTQIAENIKEQSKQDKADILTQTKLLRSTIAKNKAADAKIVSKMTNQANTLINLAPGITDDLLQQGISSDDSFNQLKKALTADEDKNAYFLSSWAKEKGVDPASIYKPRERKSTSRLVSSLRTPAVIPEKSKPVSSDSESVLKTLLGAGMGSDRILDEAEKRIGRSGRGSMSSSDMQYAYGTPSRRVAPLDKPVSFNRVQEQSGQEIKAMMEITPKYYKKIFEIAVPKGTLSKTPSEENIATVLNKSGLDRKINAVIRSVTKGNPKYTNYVIDQQFKPPSDANKDVIRQYETIKANLKSSILRDYGQALTTLNELIADRGKPIIAGENPSVLMPQ
jgi:hypothetical protein